MKIFEKKSQLFYQNFSAKNVKLKCQIFLKFHVFRVIFANRKKKKPYTKKYANWPTLLGRSIRL